MYAGPFVAGSFTGACVCVAVAGPLEPSVGEIFSDPSAMLKKLIVRLKTARAPCAVEKVSEVFLLKQQEAVMLTLVVGYFVP